MNELETAMLVNGLSYSVKGRKLKTKQEDEKFILKNLKFKLRVGEIIGIVGEAGSGKTTLGKLLTGEIKPTHGNIFLRPEEDICNEIDEIDRRLRKIEIELREKYGKEAESGEDEEREMLRSRFAEIAEEASTEGKTFRKSGRNSSVYMLQQDLLSQMREAKTVSKIIDERIIKELKKTKEEAVYIRDSLCIELGIKEYVIKGKMSDLSLEDAQKVLLATILSVEPDVIILDEFFSSMDTRTRLFLTDVIRRRTVEKKMSCILLTPDMNIASQFTDTVFIMYKGSIVESARAERIFSGPLHPYTQASIVANSIGGYTNLDGGNNEKIVIPNASVKPAGCLYHRVCPLALKTCGWTAEEMLEPLRYAITEQKLLNNDALPDLEGIEADMEENLLELKFKKDDPRFEEPTVKSFMENLFILKAQRPGGVIFESVKFIDFEQENHNLVIQLIDSYEPFFIEVEKDHRVACHLHSKTLEEKIEEREKEESREIRFFQPDE